MLYVQDEAVVELRAACNTFDRASTIAHQGINIRDSDDMLHYPTVVHQGIVQPPALKSYVVDSLALVGSVCVLHPK